MKEIKYQWNISPRTTEIEIPKIIDCALTCIGLGSEDLLEMIICDLLPSISMSDIKQFGEFVGYGDMFPERKQDQMDIFIDYVKDLDKWISSEQDLLGL
jgi:hypothetical protein